MSHRDRLLELLNERSVKRGARSSKMCGVTFIPVRKMSAGPVPPQSR